MIASTPKYYFTLAQLSEVNEASFSNLILSLHLILTIRLEEDDYPWLIKEETEALWKRISG